MVNFMALRHSIKISDSQEGLFGNGSSNGRRECLCALKSEIQYWPLCHPSNKCCFETEGFERGCEQELCFFPYSKMRYN